MGTKAVAIAVAFGILLFVGTFIWGAFRPSGPAQTTAAGGVPTATVSEALSEGRLDVEVYALGNLDVRLDIRFMPDAQSTEATAMRPDVYVAMVNMNMGGFDPALELVESGSWRADLKLPMAGRWVVNVGFDEEFAEVEFDAN